MSEVVSDKKLDFIRTIITEDIEKNKNDGKVVTRFPPEPKVKSMSIP